MTRTDTNAEITGDHAPGWTSFPIEELVTSGLLHRANREVFWPLGLSLGVHAPVKPPDGQDYSALPGRDGSQVRWGEAYLTIESTVPPEAIASSTNDAPAVDYQAWEAKRKAALR